MGPILSSPKCEGCFLGWDRSYLQERTSCRRVREGSSSPPGLGRFRASSELLDPREAGSWNPPSALFSDFRGARRGSSPTAMKLGFDRDLNPEKYGQTLEL